jgi:hypothetical protein
MTYTIFCFVKSIVSWYSMIEGNLDFTFSFIFIFTSFSPKKWRKKWNLNFPLHLHTGGGDFTFYRIISKGGKSEIFVSLVVSLCCCCFSAVMLLAACCCCFSACCCCAVLCWLQMCSLLTYVFFQLNTCEFRSKASWFLYLFNYFFSLKLFDEYFIDARGNCFWNVTLFPEYSSKKGLNENETSLWDRYLLASLPGVGVLS